MAACLLIDIRTLMLICVCRLPSARLPSARLPQPPCGLLPTAWHDAHAGSPKLRSLRAAAVLSPVRAPRARPVTSALHHAFAFFRPLISAAVLCRSTALQALGAVTSAERARARTAVARREPRPTWRSGGHGPRAAPSAPRAAPSAPRAAPRSDEVHARRWPHAPRGAVGAARRAAIRRGPRAVVAARACGPVGAAASRGDPTRSTEPDRLGITRNGRVTSSSDKLPHPSPRGVGAHGGPGRGR